MFNSCEDVPAACREGTQLTDEGAILFLCRLNIPASHFWLNILKLSLEGEQHASSILVESQFMLRSVQVALFLCFVA